MSKDDCWMNNSDHSWQPPRKRSTLAGVALLSILPTFTNAKIGGVQPEDIVLLGISAIFCARWLCGGFRLRVPEKIRFLYRGYGWLLFFLFCLAILAHRMPVFPLEDVSVLKTPVLFSISRYIQFFSVVIGFLWLADAFLKDKRRLLLALDLYWWTGIISCGYASISYVLLKVSSINILGAYDTDGAVRARGFFNEGGPFGGYLISVVIIGLLRRRITGKRLGYLNLLICASAFFLCESRAAFLIILMISLVSVLSAASFRKKVVYLVLAGLILAGVAFALNVAAVFQSYLNSYQNIEQTMSTMETIDPNLVMGRVAAAYIVPRMIEAHPLTGIGIGNYPLMRNDPHYLGQLPDIRYYEDLPGLGLIGDTAEFGIPAMLFLVILLLNPYRMCERKASILGVAALFQLFAHLLVAHLTFFYPWFVTACAIASNEYEEVKVKEPVRNFLRLMSRPPLAT